MSGAAPKVWPLQLIPRLHRQPMHHQLKALRLMKRRQELDVVKIGQAIDFPNPRSRLLQPGQDRQPKRPEPAQAAVIIRRKGAQSGARVVPDAANLASSATSLRLLRVSTPTRMRPPGMPMAAGIRAWADKVRAARCRISQFRPPHETHRGRATAGAVAKKVRGRPPQPLRLSRVDFEWPRPDRRGRFVYGNQRSSAIWTALRAAPFSS